MDRRTFKSLTSMQYGKQRPPKSAAILRQNTCRRVALNHGVEPTMAELREVERQIREKDRAVYVGKESCSLTCWRVMLRGKEMYFVYHSRVGAVKTCMSESNVRVTYPEKIV